MQAYPIKKSSAHALGRESDWILPPGAPKDLS